VAPQAGLNDGSLASRQANSQTGTPLASVSTFNPLQNSALFNLGQNQSMAFFQSLLSALGGGMGAGGGGGSAPMMAPAQSNAINFALQQIGAENWNRQRDASMRNWFSPTPVGAGSLQGVPSIAAPMGGGFLPAHNPVMEQFLSSQRLAPSVAIGSAAASFGGTGPVGPQPVRSGWSAPAFGF
jgi:hypothetical protein